MFQNFINFIYSTQVCMIKMVCVFLHSLLEHKVVSMKLLDENSVLIEVLTLHCCFKHIEETCHFFKYMPTAAIEYTNVEMPTATIDYEIFEWHFIICFSIYTLNLRLQYIFCIITTIVCFLNKLVLVYKETVSVKNVKYCTIIWKL